MNDQWYEKGDLPREEAVLGDDKREPGAREERRQGYYA